MSSNSAMMYETIKPTRPWPIHRLPIRHQHCARCGAEQIGAAAYCTNCGLAAGTILGADWRVAVGVLLLPTGLAFLLGRTIGRAK